MPMKISSICLLSVLLINHLLSAKPMVASEEYGMLHLRAREGSFRMFEGEGRVVIDSSGTVLISGLVGQVKKSDDIRLQYQNDERQVYFGHGKIEVQGRFRAIQWSGKNLVASWCGKGVLRFLGEYDGLSTKEVYWYDDSPKQSSWRTMHSYGVRLPKG